MKIFTGNWVAFPKFRPIHFLTVHNNSPYIQFKNIRQRVSCPLAFLANLIGNLILATAQLELKTSLRPVRALPVYD